MLKTEEPDEKILKLTKTLQKVIPNFKKEVDLLKTQNPYRSEAFQKVISKLPKEKQAIVNYLILPMNQRKIEQTRTFLKIVKSFSTFNSSLGTAIKEPDLIKLLHLCGFVFYPKDKKIYSEGD